MKQKNWFKPKSFTHLTQKLSQEDGQWIKRYVSNPNNIKQHKFYPLLHRTIVLKRLKTSLDKKGNVCKRHYTYENGERKPNIKYREIYYPNHLDAHIYSYYTQKILEPLYETQLSKDEELNRSVLAYRRIPLDDDTRCKCNIDFANETFNLIKNSKDSIAVLALDISKFFDSLDHKILKKAWAKLLNRKDLDGYHFNLYKSVTRFHYTELKDILKEFEYKHVNDLIDKDVSCFVQDGLEFRNRIKEKGLIKLNPFRRKEKNDDGTETKIMVGIPQGTPISAFLANLYLLEFDKKALELLNECHGIYRRYSDDILIVCSKDICETIAAKFYELIKEFKLVIQSSKTQTTFFTNGKLEKGQKPVTYLGFQFDGNRKLLKAASISKFHRKMKKNVRYRASRAYIAKQKNLKGFNVESTLHRKKLYQQFSYLGANNKSFKKRNYISYANFASKIMDSPEINNQLSKAWQILHDQISKYEGRYNLTSFKT